MTHHHIVLPTWISLTLSRNPSLSSIASSRSSRLHPVSTQSCCISVLAGRPAFACPCEGVHRSISLMSLSLLLQQSPTCLVRLTGIVFMMGDRRPYSCCFVGCYLQDLFSIACSILVYLLSSFFSTCLVSVHPYSSIDTNTAWKKLCFIIDRTLTSTTTAGQTGPDWNGNKEELYIHHSALGPKPHHQMQFRVIPRTISRDGYNPSAEVQSVYFTAPANRAK